MVPKIWMYLSDEGCDAHLILLNLILILILVLFSILYFSFYDFFSLVSSCNLRQ